MSQASWDHHEMHEPLTVQLLREEASSFTMARSKHAEPSLFGITDGKAVDIVRLI